MQTYPTVQFLLDGLFLKARDPTRMKSPKSMKAPTSTKSNKSSKSSCKERTGPYQENEVVFLGVKTAFSYQVGELELEWRPPIFVEDICVCDDDKSTKSSKAPTMKSDKKSIGSPTFSSKSMKSTSPPDSRPTPSSKSKKASPAPMEMLTKSQKSLMNSSSSSSSKRSKSGAVSSVPAVPSSKPTNAPAATSTSDTKSSKSQKSTRRVMEESENTERIRGNITYLIFIQDDPFELVDMTLSPDTANYTTNMTNFAISDLEPGKGYWVIVYALLGRGPDTGPLLLTNNNIVENITISAEDAKLYTDEFDFVNISDMDLNASIVEWYNDTGSFLDEDMGDKVGYSRPDGAVDDSPRDLNEKVSDASDTTVYNLTIRGDLSKLQELAKKIEEVEQGDKKLTVSGIDEFDVPFALFVSNYELNEETAGAEFLQISGTEASPTQIFETLDIDYQEDAFNEDAEDRIFEQCEDFFESTGVFQRRTQEASLKIPFASVDVRVNDTVDTDIQNTTVTLKFRANFALYLKVRVKIQVSKVYAELELGGGYDYLLSAGIDKGKSKSMRKKPNKDLWNRKEKTQILVTIGPVVVFFTWQPFVAYDYGFEVSGGDEFDVLYEKRGGDYAALVLDTDSGLSTKREKKLDEATPFDEIISIPDDSCPTVTAELGIRAGLRLKFFGKKDYSADPAVRAGIEFTGELDCDGSLEPTPNRFNGTEPDETRAISLLPSNPPRWKTFDIEFVLSVPIVFRLRLCFGIRIKINLGFVKIDIKIEVCVIKINEEVEIVFLSIPLLNLPDPKLVTEEYVCRPDGILNQAVEATDLSSTNNNVEPGSSTWVLLFDDPSGSWTTLENLKGESGDIQLGSGMPGAFCCGVEKLTDWDAFLISTPEIPPFLNQDTLLTWSETQSPDKGKICKTLQQCTLEKFYDECIGDEICEVEGCNWKNADGSFGEDYCIYEGIRCIGGNVVEINRENNDHKGDCELFEELRYLGYLETLNLGWVPCLKRDFLTCLDDSGLNQTELACAEDVCGFETFVDADPMNNTTCLTAPDDQNILSCLIENCSIPEPLFPEKEFCVEYQEGREESVRIGGVVPSDLWSIPTLSKSLAAIMFCFCTFQCHVTHTTSLFQKTFL
ncbi:MAG: hypothetical protein SGILL_002271 [Bacillariaceae sp.]